MTQRAIPTRSELLDLVPSRSQQSEKSVWTAHMPGTNDDEICFATAQVAFDFWHPVTISDVDETAAERRKIAKRFSKHTTERVGVATSPRTNQAAATSLCLLVTGQSNAAIGYLQKGATLNSRYGPVWEHLGVAYKKQGRHRDAVSALENATRLLPSSGLAWRHLAEAYQATGRSAEAQRAAARAQQLGSAAPGANKKKA